MSADRLADFPAVTDRRYGFARSNIASIAPHDAKVMASDKIILRTSPRGTFTVRCNAIGPAAFKSASVRAPINAGKTVAARTRRFLMAREYFIPQSSPAFALSSQVRWIGWKRSGSER